MLKGPKPRPIPRNLRLAPSSDVPPEKPAEPEPIEPPTWLGSRAKKIFAIKATQIRSSGYWEPRFEESLALLSTFLSEYRRAPSKMSSARLTQMRLLLSELGLTPQSSRGVDRR